MAEKKEKQYVSDNAQLMAEWNWEKNTDFRPSQIALHSNKKVWWKCSLEHEWCAVVSHRIKGVGCPYCSNKKVLVGYNDLATTDPYLAREWHPIKNGELKPADITHGAGVRVWWQCSLGHEWQTTPNKRTTEKTSCPVCSNKKILVGFNDLETTHPRLASEWHPELNESLTPRDVTFGSSRKVWWKCRLGHEWQASISNRSKNRNCPICSSQTKTSFPEQAIYYYLNKVFEDVENKNTAAIGMELDIYIPSIKTAIEYDGVYYHKLSIVSKREQKKNFLCKEKGIRLIRLREKDLECYNDCECIVVEDPSKNQEVQKAIEKLLEFLDINNLKVDLLNDNSRILDSYLLLENDRSLERVNPVLATEWHPTKNGNLKPSHLSANSSRIVWWQCINGHEWQASLHNRSKGKGCPYCSGRIAIIGENDLASLRPDLICEWDVELNKPFSPSNFKIGSNEKVWWTCNTCGHKWKASINGRTAGHGCPECGELKKGPERKTHDVFTQELEAINPQIDLIGYYTVSTEKIRCRCLICKNEWYALPGNLLKGKGCPYCSGREVLSGVNDLEYKFPEIAKEWDFDKNTPLLPSEVKCGSNKRVWWKCGACGHIYQMPIVNRTTGYGCPECRGDRIGRRLRKAPEAFANELKIINPRIEVISEYSSSKEKVVCLCLACKNKWEALPGNLLKGHGCPECAKQKHMKN